MCFDLSGVNTILLYLIIGEKRASIMVIPQDMSADVDEAYIFIQENGQEIVLDSLSYALPVPGSLLTVYLRIIRQQ